MKNLGIWILSVIGATTLINLVILLVILLVCFLMWDMILFNEFYGTWNDLFDLFRFTLIFGVIFGTRLYNDIKD